ncbi:hypothetical protein [Nocardiopsis potens]|uniref:hypothetical protein n=1 Tax=Nocardiopsis potens TaxID=1246458 RepID=UPI000370E7A4|nr:hypothetical protein [Nocardiopsis potens]
MSTKEKAAAGRVRKKRGIYGWRAFFIVFFSGTAAAFLVMGIIVGSLRLVFSGLFSDGGTAASNPQAVEQRKPRESMEVGALDLCEVADTDVMAGKGGQMVEGGGVADSGEEEGEESPGRTVMDECRWTFTPSGQGEASLDLWYTAFVNDSEKESKEEAAQGEFEEQLRRVEAGFSGLSGSGTSQNTKAEAEYFFGENPDGGADYVAVGKMKSGVFVATYTKSQKPEDIKREYEQVFREEVRALDIAISTEIERILPD